MRSDTPSSFTFVAIPGVIRERCPIARALPTTRVHGGAHYRSQTWNFVDAMSTEKILGCHRLTEWNVCWRQLKERTFRIGRWWPQNPMSMWQSHSGPWDPTSIVAQFWNLIQWPPTAGCTVLGIKFSNIQIQSNTSKLAAVFLALIHLQQYLSTVWPQQLFKRWYFLVVSWLTGHSTTVLSITTGC